MFSILGCVPEILHRHEYLHQGRRVVLTFEFVVMVIYLKVVQISICDTHSGVAMWVLLVPRRRKVYLFSEKRNRRIDKIEE
jgi:hypothetical protein